MAQEKDLYQILGVSKSAGEDEIRTAYRKLARQYHPDFNPGDKQSEEKFKEIAVAFEVLGDKEKRKLYDEFGMASVRPGFNAEQARAYQQWGGGASYGDMFGGGGNPFGGGGGMNFDLGNIFEQFFGGGGARQPRPTGPTRGSDIEQELQIDFLDAILGTKREISLRKSVHCDTCKGSGSRTGRTATCPQCKGSGRIQQQQSGFFASTHICNQCGGTGEAITDPCKDCRGSGIQTKSVNLTVTVPPGVTDDSRIRLSGQGAAGKNGGRLGDLYLRPRVRNHPFYTRSGDDVLMDLPLTLYEAYNGAQIEIPTPTGPVNLRVPPGAQPDQKMRLRGKGVASHKGRAAGDLIITLKLRMPTKEDPEAAEHLKALESLYTEDIRASLQTA